MIEQNGLHVAKFLANHSSQQRGGSTCLLASLQVSTPLTQQGLTRPVTKSATIAQVLDASPSKLRGDTADRLLGHLVSARSDSGKLEVKQSERGRPQVYQRLTFADTSSEAASERTKRRRTAELRSLTESVCGGSAGASAQTVAILRRMSSDEQMDLLREAGLAPHSPEAGIGLAIKADLMLPWNQLRKLRQWLKQCGVKFESERKMRTTLAAALPPYTAKDVPMVVKKQIALAPVVYMPSLEVVINHYLQLYKDRGLLTWHDGAIPESEVWIKLGGDHGGDSFKFSMQVANLQHPNSPDNTVPLCVFHAKDTPANLETALGMYRDEVLHLISHGKWEGKRLVLFIFGDYEFQCSMYGLSGPSGLRPCLHCHCKKKSMETPVLQREPEDSVPRSLATLSSNLLEFIADGERLPNAKLHNNVIRPAILPVPLPNVIVPVLHLDLGIFAWMFDAMLKDLRELDKLLASKAQSAAGDSDAFGRLSGLYRDHHDAEEQIAAASEQASGYQQQLNYVALHAHNQGVTGGNLEFVCEQIRAEWQKANDTVVEMTNAKEGISQQILAATAEKDICGPCESAVEPVLQSHNIKRQVYHGGAFIGNHVHRALQPAVLQSIAAAPISVIQERCPDLMDDASVVQLRYMKLLDEYRKCTSAFGHCRKVTRAEVEELESNIRTFLKSARKEVVDRGLGHITPKLHLLESHTAPAMERLGVGLGLLAEQGAESIHAEFNTLERRYRQIPALLQRLKAMAEQHLSRTLPQAIHRPTTKRRQST
ncbi:uncharacterized protein LOC135823213 [Sycon ciliatum]|uniref:uncharacterized protein LOC135823213 n=1 Tax=Sycon ciliatum TaxID=27933 RepID=UPI0031F64457